MKFNCHTTIKALLHQEKLKYNDIIPQLMEKTGRRKYNANNLSKRISYGSFTYDEMLALCEILGYEIKIEKIK